ncbi:STAS domain-containing protein [Nocardia nova]|nr:STAS domain-containing protein [Nocardia nova]
MRTHGSAVVLSVRGEADAWTLDDWRRLVHEGAAVAASRDGPLVVDTGGMDFLGWRALRALAEEAAERRGRGGAICLVSRSPTIARMAAVDPLTAELAIHATVVAALSSLPAPPAAAN